MYHLKIKLASPNSTAGVCDPTFGIGEIKVQSITSSSVSGFCYLRSDASNLSLHSDDPNLVYETRNCERVLKHQYPTPGCKKDACG